MRLHAVEAGPAAGDAAAAGRAPVVLLHGLFGQARNLGRIARALAAGRRVVSFDLRSHGASPHGPLRLRDMAGDVAESMDAAGLASAAVVGHSLGGKTAMALALAEPARVRRLLVADIAPVPYRHSNLPLAQAMKAMALAPGLTRAAAHAALAPAIPDAAVRDLLLQNLVTGAVPAWRLGLDEIIGSMDEAEGWPDFHPEAAYGGQALFLRGERSDYVRPAHEATIRRLFPHADIATLPDAGHWLHAEQPEAFGRVVGDFVRGADREAPAG